MQADYKSQNSLQDRKISCAKIRDRFKDRVPIIVERAPGSNSPLITRKKFLAPNTLTVAKFIQEIRTFIQLSPDKALFITINGKHSPPPSMTMIDVYVRHRDEDGFLYVNYSEESTFG